MSFLDIIQKYASGPTVHADTTDHFDQVAREAPREDLGSGIASMFRSSSTAPFGSMIGSLFGQSDPAQKAGVLNSILQSLGPAALGAGAGGVLSKILGTSATPDSVPTVTPEQASQLRPSDVSALAAHAEQHNPSIVDTVSGFYAQHPTLVKSLGVAALAVAMSHMRR